MPEEGKSRVEPVLLQHEFHLGAGGKQSVVARLGFPRAVKDGREWACSFQLQGWKDGRIRTAHGLDGLHALTIAAGAIRKWLDEAGAERDSSHGLHYQYFRGSSHPVTDWKFISICAPYWIEKSM